MNLISFFLQHIGVSVATACQLCGFIERFYRYFLSLIRRAWLSAATIFLVVVNSKIATNTVDTSGMHDNVACVLYVLLEKKEKIIHCVFQLCHFSLFSLLLVFLNGTFYFLLFAFVLFFL